MADLFKEAGIEFNQGSEVDLLDEAGLNIFKPVPGAKIKNEEMNRYYQPEGSNENDFMYKLYTISPLDKNFNFEEAANQAGRSALAGLAKSGRGLINAPHTLASMISPEFANKYLSPYKPNFNYEEALGVKPTMENEIIAGLMEYLPISGAQSAASGAKGIAGMTARLGETGFQEMLSSILNQKSGQRGIEQGAQGVGLQAGLESLGQAGKLLSKPIDRFAEKFGMYKFSNNLLNEIKESLPKQKAEGFKQAVQNAKKQQENENNLWNKVDDIANKETDAIPTQMDDFFKNINNKIESIKNNKTLFPINEKYKATVDSLEEFVNTNQPQINNTADALNLGKALNELYRKKMDLMGNKPDKKVIKSLISDYKTKMNQFLDENQLSNLKEAWQNANKATQETNKTFNKVSSAPGKVKDSALSKLMQGERSAVNEEEFIKEYLPRPHEEGTARMKQYAKVVGDEDLAKSEMIKAMFKIKNKNDINIKDVVKKYKDMPEEQRNYLFSIQQRKKIDTLKNVLKKDPHALKKPYYKNIFHEAFYAIPTAIEKGVLRPIAGTKRMQESIMKKNLPELTIENKRKYEPLATALKAGLAKNNND